MHLHSSLISMHKPNLSTSGRNFVKTACLHFFFVLADVVHGHAVPVVDPGEGLAVADEEDLANSLKKNEHE